MATSRACQRVANKLRGSSSSTLPNSCPSALCCLQNQIIGVQNTSLAAEQATVTALAAIQGLAQMQLAAQQALAVAVQNQLTAIKTAAFSGVITITQVCKSCIDVKAAKASLSQ